MAGYKRYNEELRTESDRTLRKDYVETMGRLLRSERAKEYREMESEVVSKYTTRLANEW